MKKTSKVWFAIQILLFESIKKTLDTYLHIFETIINPITLYNYESWGFCNKKSKSKVEQLHLALRKQVLGVRKATSNVQALTVLDRFPFKVYIATQMFKYLQRLPFL